MDRDSFFGRAHSSSYVAHGVADMRAFDAELGKLFDSYEKNGRVEMAYTTIILRFKP